MNLARPQLTVLVLLFVFKIYAQVPNGDFEQWSNGNPDSWWTNNFTTTTITQTSDSHSGSSAVRGETVLAGGNILQPLMILGEIGKHGLPVSDRYLNLTGFYKLTPINNENFNVLVVMYKNGQFIGIGGSQFFATSSYTNFIVPINYNNGETPDSCQISITIGDNNGPVDLGSVFYLDDLSFQGTTGLEVESIEVTSFNLEQNYPNPFNPTTTIRYTIPNVTLSGVEGSKVQLKVYDILGNEIAKLVDEYKPAGNYEVNFSASQLSSGIYFYKIQAGDFVETKKMILMK